MLSSSTGKKRYSLYNGTCLSITDDDRYKEHLQPFSSSSVNLSHLPWYWSHSKIKIKIKDRLNLFASLLFRNAITSKIWLKYLVLLRPLNFHRRHGVLQCSRRSLWALFAENCPSLPQRHLIPV